MARPAAHRPFTAQSPRTAAARPALQVKYFTTLPDSLAGVRKVAAGMKFKSSQEYIEEAAEEEEKALKGGRHRKPPAMVAAM